MWIPIITSLVCFAVATILFTPPLRKFPFYQAVSFYFLFEGAWTLFNTLITAIWPYADFMIWVHHVGIILFAGYLFYKIYVYYWRQRREEKGRRSRLPGKRSFPKKTTKRKGRKDRKMMEYVYAGMWFLIGLLLIWKLRKENQVFVFAGGIFLFMGAWWLADALLPQLDLFGGVYAWIFRGVMAAALIVTGLVFFRQKRRDAEQRALEEEEGGAEEAADEESGGDSSED